IAHINHCLRGKESTRDEQFVQSTAKEIGVLFFSEKIDIGSYKKRFSLSTQAAGRKARTDFFYKIACEQGYDKIAVGHTKNDQCETVLINLIRGTGLKGLGGIHPVFNKKIVRPLLEISRDEITGYLLSKKISSVEDSSNRSTKYTRNRLRHNLVPVIQGQFNGNFVDSLNTLSQTAREDEEFLQAIAMRKFQSAVVHKTKDSVTLNIGTLTNLPLSLQRRVVRLAVFHVRGDLKRIGFEHISQLLKILSSGKTGKKYTFPGRINCHIEYGNILFSSKPISQEKEFLYRFSPPGSIEIRESGLTVVSRLLEGKEARKIGESETVKLFDLGPMQGGLLIRNRRSGDIFHPSGTTGSQKLKKFFINTKVPQARRDRVPLLLSGDQIIWLLGLRRSSRYQITEKTCNALLVSIQERGPKRAEKNES
ncbi:MAG: tRNA lysidine(34) synthetase TilS, partial [Nitrospinota bacterium]